MTILLLHAHDSGQSFVKIIDRIGFPKTQMFESLGKWIDAGLGVDAHQQRGIVRIAGVVDVPLAAITVDKALPEIGSDLCGDDLHLLGRDTGAIDLDPGVCPLQ